MRPPIFIVEVNGDVIACESAERAETTVESVDVEDGEYRAAYDADGRLLELRVSAPTKRSRWGIELTPVRLVAVEDEPRHGADLHAALVTALERIGIRVSDALSLDALVVRAYSALSRWPNRKQ
jgi:uncharacterized protein with FMN-binding domain